jgi:hypothetical protein
MTRWNGDEWRWRVEWHTRAYRESIQVIERPKDEAKGPVPAAARVVPFGFARANPQPEPEPLVWDGDDA